MPRTVKKEWIGKHDDAKVPASVRQRIHDRQNGTCHLSGLPLAGQEWHLDHEIALKDGGKHRETNLRAVIAKYHRLKTAKEAAERVKPERTKQKHSGARRPKGNIPNRPFPKTGKAPKIDKSALPTLDRRQFYKGVET